MASFYRFLGDLQLGLENPAEAAIDYRQSLTYRFDLETQVSLIKALCRLRDFDETISEINRLATIRTSFSSQRDSETALRLLELICRHEEIAERVETSVLRDAISAVAIRGTAKMAWNEMKD